MKCFLQRPLKRFVLPTLFFACVTLLTACATSSDTFYGLESGNPPHAVMIDISGSMGNGAGDTIESSVARDAINTVDRTVGKVKTGSAVANKILNKVRGGLFDKARKQTTKLAESQRQLIPFVRGLPENTLFNIMAFNSDQSQISSGLLSASPRTRQDAINFINSLEAFGGTEMIPALELAISQKPATIYLVSDGHPNDSQSKILDIVRNAISKGIVINTIGVGKDQNKPFLSQIARMSGGVFTSKGISIPILSP